MQTEPLLSTIAALDIDEADASIARTGEWLKGGKSWEERTRPRAEGVVARPDSLKHSLPLRQDLSLCSMMIAQLFAVDTPASRRGSRIP